MLSMGSAGAAAAGMLTTAIAGTLSSRYPNMIAIAGLSSIATAAAAFITTRESIFRYQQNAESYRQAQDALDKLSEKIDDVRLAAANGQAEPVLQFIGAVHEQLMLEHQQWLKSSESAQEALQRLQETLDKIRAPQGKAAATTTGTRP